jgi:hypothetical protein
MNGMARKLYHWGVAAYALLIVFAVVFYMERTAFIDASMIIFAILKTGAIDIQGYRFGSAATMIWPLLAGKLGLSLKAVMLSYSVGVSCYFFICYLLCGFVFKNYRVGLVLLLFNMLFVSDSFYWIQTELPQGVAFMLVVFACATRPSAGRRSVAEYILLAAGCVTMVFFHPLVYLVAFYLLLYFAIKENRELSWRLLLFMVLCVIVSVMVKNRYFRPPYDDKAIKRTDEFFVMLPHLFSYGSTKSFIISCLHKFYWIPLTGILIVYHYIKKRQFAALGLFVTCAVGYWLLVTVCYREEVMPFYIENLYLPLAVIIGVPLVFDVLPSLEKKKYLAAGLMGLIMITGLARIYSSHQRYTARLHWEQRFLEAHKDQKLIVDRSKIPMDTLMMNWATPYEFWLLSTVKYGSSASMFITDSAGQYFMYVFNRKYMATTFGHVPYEELQPPYFVFKDTVSGFTIVK